MVGGEKVGKIVRDVPCEEALDISDPKLLDDDEEFGPAVCRIVTKPCNTESIADIEVYLVSEVIKSRNKNGCEHQCWVIVWRPVVDNGGLDAPQPVKDGPMEKFNRCRL
jgi:hypothetical protein